MDNVENCCICLEKLGNSQKECLQLSCKHSFHQSCIIEHFRRGKTECPLCRDDPYSYNIEDEIDDWENTMLEVRRKRMRELRERQHLAQTIPIVKKKQELFRKCKENYLENQKKYRKEADLLAKEYQINILRKKMNDSFHRYLASCVQNRKTKPGQEFESYLSMIRYNT